jgi:DNA-binding response OmpR family regulator
MSRILLVEDDHGLRGVLRIVLQQSGYDVSETDSGAGVEALVAREIPDLVITDVMMPGVDGVEVVRSLTRRFPQVPILAISGGGDSHGLHMLELVGKLGAADTLKKPFPNATLLAKVQAILDRRPVTSLSQA